MNENGIGRVYGVDFSGGQKAGDKIWLASGSVEGETLFIEGCYRARDLPNSSRSRDTCFVALRQFIESKSDTAFGLDFPFGLPRDIVDGPAEWQEFVEAFPDTYDSPSDFYDQCKAAGAAVLDEGVEIRRETDLEANAPWCPYNLRLRYQTYHGIADLLAPLAASDGVRVVPMQTPKRDLPMLMEVCPSSTLDDCDLPREGYKNRSEEGALARGEILSGLEEQGVLLADGIRDIALADSEGDAVDSLVAAFATHRAVRGDLTGESNGVEGHIYV